MGIIKKDKEIARLKSSDLAKKGGFYVNYAYDSSHPGQLMVAIRIGRCHRKAVERNKFRRWIKEILRWWLKESDFKHRKFGLNLLVSVGVKDKSVSFSYVKETLTEILDDIVKRYAEGNKTLT